MTVVPFSWLSPVACARASDGRRTVSCRRCSCSLTKKNRVDGQEGLTISSPVYDIVKVPSVIFENSFFHRREFPIKSGTY